ncbi:MAG: hypothetical protein JNJ59_01430 [Deltaproteobacteria bacterium]|nr:hypothetical protein [Deltaproteobacteria bacterium]
MSVANLLKSSGHPLGSRFITYNDVVVRGVTEIYNEGIAAGRVHILEPGFSPTEIASDEIVILPEVPDDIPATRAIVSSVPQLPLAHVNLLAKSRGTPNAHVAGILSWGQLTEWDWARTPVIMQALPDRVRWQAMSTEQYDLYKSRITPPVRHVTQVSDLASAPLTVSLTEGGIANMAPNVPLIGGKAAGFLSFLEVPGMETPDLPMAISIKAFAEHQAALKPQLQAAFQQPDFKSDSRVRYLVLEGEAAFRTTNIETPITLAFLAEFHTNHDADVLGDLVRRGGVKQIFLDQPMRYETLRDLRQALEARYATLAPTQALRFRSSSTAEDVPGFNGAGLYVSNTGFLYPSLLTDPGDRKKTVEYAVKQTWASYWGYQGFEERRAQAIDHFEGNMAVVVHPRFDDNKEKTNAVATFWLTNYRSPATRRLNINVQKGSLSVTNPGGTSELPEIDEVTQTGTEPPVIRRVRASTVADPGELLFSDAELLTLFAQASAHADKWLASLGQEGGFSERPRTLVLDYELKYMKAGWPAMASGEVRPERILWRQSRVLDQVTRVRASIGDPWDTVNAIPLVTFMPTDLRTVARSVGADRCDSEWADIRVYFLYNDAAQSELFPFATTPFIYRVSVDFKKAPPGLNPSLATWSVQWTNLPERTKGGGTRVTFSPQVVAGLNLDGFEVGPTPGGTFKVWKGDTSYVGSCTTRNTQFPFQSATDYLRTLMPAE